MALTREELAIALRLSGDGTVNEAVGGILHRLGQVARAHVTLMAPMAPAEVGDEATIRMASYLYDMPTASRRDGYANAWLNSGAGALVGPWAPRRMAGAATEEAAMPRQVLRPEQTIGDVFKFLASPATILVQDAMPTNNVRLQIQAPSGDWVLSSVAVFLVSQWVVNVDTTFDYRLITDTAGPSAWVS